MEEELLAAEALLELRNPVVFSWGIPYSWGSKRRRSAEEAQPSILRRFITTLWAQGPVNPAKEEKVNPEVASLSPDTPLCLSPGSDSSNENNPTRRLKTRKHSINNNNNRRKKEAREISRSNNTNEILKTEDKNAKHLRKLESNKILKAWKLEMINETMKMKEKTGILLGADGVLSQRDSVKTNTIVDDTRDLIPREPINEDNPTTVTESEIPSSCTTYEPSTDEKEVPRIDIDLNAPPSGSFPPNCWDGSNIFLFDQVGFRRAMAAQARQRRMRIFRRKKNK